MFLYHPFGPELVRKIVSRLADSGAGRETFFVYENPVYGDVLDTDPRFQRWFARTVPYDPSELGRSPSDNETVVVWRHGHAARQSDADANRPIVVTEPGWRAELSASQAA